MITPELLSKANEASAKFIDAMRSDELGIFTIRKAFEMGYLRGTNEVLKDLEKETKDGI
jgi:hypothetical protein